MTLTDNMRTGAEPEPPRRHCFKNFYIVFFLAQRNHYQVKRGLTAPKRVRRVTDPQLGQVYLTGLTGGVVLGHINKGPTMQWRLTAGRGIFRPQQLFQGILLLVSD
jgi:hypothetical protein